MTGDISTPEQISAQKRAMRAEVRERRGLLSQAQRDAAAAGIAAQLDELLARTGATTITCYLSTVTEPGTRAFINAAMARGVRVLLPVTRGDGLLDWAVGREDDQERVGLFGLAEPDGEVLGPMAADDADLLIIPASAVSADGFRLGWGRGYYDKMIGSMAKVPPTYAVIYDAEFTEHVPVEAHDQRVTGAITPTRIIDIAPEA